MTKQLASNIMCTSFFLFFCVYFTFPLTSFFPTDSFVTLSPSFAVMCEQLILNASSTFSGNPFEVEDGQKYIWQPIQKKDVGRWQRLHIVVTFFLPSMSMQWTPIGKVHFLTLSIIDSFLLLAELVSFIGVNPVIAAESDTSSMTILFLVVRRTLSLFSEVDDMGGTVESSEGSELGDILLAEFLPLA